jgi:hypothetical protein
VTPCNLTQIYRFRETCCLRFQGISLIFLRNVGKFLPDYTFKTKVFFIVTALRTRNSHKQFWYKAILQTNKMALGTKMAECWHSCRNSYYGLPSRSGRFTSGESLRYLLDRRLRGSQNWSVFYFSHSLFTKWRFQSVIVESQHKWTLKRK